MNRSRIQCILALISLIFLCSCKEAIIHNLSEIEANKLITQLGEGQIAAEKEKQSDGKWRVSVSKAEVLMAIRFLDKGKYFRTDSKTSTEKTSVISSREEQRFGIERALSKEIETTLSSIEGVLYARVHLNVPQKDPVFGSRIGDDRGSASVLLLVDTNYGQQKEDIASLVGGASGVDKSSIAVLVTERALAAFAKESMPDSLLQQNGLAASASTFLRDMPGGGAQRMSILGVLLMGSGGCMIMLFLLRKIRTK